MIGTLRPEGWGAAAGYPGIHLDEHGGTSQASLSSDEAGRTLAAPRRIRGRRLPAGADDRHARDGTTVDAYVYALAASQTGGRRRGPRDLRAVVRLSGCLPPCWPSPPGRADVAGVPLPSPAPAPTPAPTAQFATAGDPESDGGATWTLRGPVDGAVVDLHGVLMKPTGSAPFPAVAISHGYGGSARQFSTAMGREMRGWGLVAIATDYTHAGGGPTGAPGGANDLRQRRQRDPRARDAVDPLVVARLRGSAARRRARAAAWARWAPPRSPPPTAISCGWRPTPPAASAWTASRSARHRHWRRPAYSDAVPVAPRRQGRRRAAGDGPVVRGGAGCRRPTKGMSTRARRTTSRGTPRRWAASGPGTRPTGCSESSPGTAVLILLGVAITAAGRPPRANREQGQVQPTRRDRIPGRGVGRRALPRH